MNHSRKPAVAGRFYPENPSLLRSEVTRLLKEAKAFQNFGKLPMALIVPHAGYIFSGMTAAAAYNQLGSDPAIDKVFILASSHHFQFPGASVFCSGNYETPLGKITIDYACAYELNNSNPLFSNREDAHLPEHSLEVQLPFLQVLLDNNFRLIPIILGTQNRKECILLAKTLSPYLTENNLFVISSDFSHYPAYDDALEIDRITTQAILANDPELLYDTLEKNKNKNIPGLLTSLCGWASVLTLLCMTQKRDFKYQWIDYMNSGDQHLYGDHDRVVGYSAIAIY